LASPLVFAVLFVVARNADRDRSIDFCSIDHRTRFQVELAKKQEAYAYIIPNEKDNIEEFAMSLDKVLKEINA